MGRFLNVLNGAAEQTNAELASEISSLTRFTDAELKSLAPTKADKELLLTLLEIVNEGTTEMQKVKKLKDNINTLAPIVLGVVKKLAL